MKKTTFFFGIFGTIFALLIIYSASYQCKAQPYGEGIYNEDIPYGNMTSLSIATDGNVNIPISPDSNGVLNTGTSNITVTSTDVNGYKLYLRALNNIEMTNDGSSIPASSNETPAELDTNTWGYNTDDSNTFVGITLTDTLIRSVSNPVKSGSTTTVTYGVKLDLSKPSGSYSSTVVYTAVPQTD